MYLNLLIIYVIWIKPFNTDKITSNYINVLKFIFIFINN